MVDAGKAVVVGGVVGLSCSTCSGVRCVVGSCVLVLGGLRCVLVREGTPLGLYGRALPGRVIGYLR